MGGKFVHLPLINLILGMFTWREEDPITGKILEGRSS